MQAYQLEIPAESLEAGFNGIRFEFGYAVSPAEAGISADPRPLSAMFDELRLARAGER
jgi:hypothetical protein